MKEPAAVRRVKIDLDYLEPNRSYINPLCSEDGVVLLHERSVLTEDMIIKIKMIYGKDVFFFETDDEPIAEKAIPPKVFQIAVDGSRNVINEISETNRLSRSTYIKAERMVEEIVSDLNYREIKVISLLKDMKSYDEYIYQHLVNVGILTALFAQKIGIFTPEEIKHITLGAYLIDIGLMKINRHLLRKEGAYALTEFRQIKQHPQLGYELLKEIKNIHPIVLQTVLLHHEKYNNRGYYGLPYEHLPYASKIASICDIYDACTTHRPFRDAFTPPKTMKVLLNTTNSGFDHRLVSDFITFLWPKLNIQQNLIEKNDFCVLSTYEIAVVKNIARNDILRPKLTVFSMFKSANSKAELAFFKRPIEVDLKKDASRFIIKVITEKPHIEYLKRKLYQVA